MRTLVISDLHLGARTQTDVLRRPAALDVLLEGLDGVEPARPAGRHARAAPRAVRRGAGGRRARCCRRSAAGWATARSCSCAGNHDHGLVADWLEACGRPGRSRERAGPDATPRTRRLAELLAPASCRSPTRASGWPTASTRRTATTSTATSPCPASSAWPWARSPARCARRPLKRAGPTTTSSCSRPCTPGSTPLRPAASTAAACGPAASPPERGARCSPTPGRPGGLAPPAAPSRWRGRRQRARPRAGAGRPLRRGPAPLGPAGDARRSSRGCGSEPAT